jgi:hypothetical protein
MALEPSVRQADVTPVLARLILCRQRYVTLMAEFYAEIFAT